MDPKAVPQSRNGLTLGGGWIGAVQSVETTADSPTHSAKSRRRRASRRLSSVLYVRYAYVRRAAEQALSRKVESDRSSRLVR
jgi:hypothetical protein